MRIQIAIVSMALVAAACGKKHPEGTPVGGPSASGSDTASASDGSGAASDLAPPDHPVAKINGPSITPTVTGSITFATPKDPKSTWFEVSFPCYRAAIELQPGNKASDAFTQVSPLIAPALAAADIDLDHDVAAIGGWSCGEGPCIYMALTLRHPEKISDMLKTIPGIQPKKVADNHWSFDAPGEQGMREIHIRALPIQWGQPLPTDDWAKDQAKATHVLFISGLMGKGDVEPLSVLADAKTAPALVKDAEGLLPDSHGRCAVGVVGPNDWKPGFKLDRARFAMAAPPGGGDALTKLIGSDRTLDVELEANLTPPPAEKDYNAWYAEAKDWISSTVDPIKMQFAGGGPMVDAYFDMMSLVASRGFDHQIKGKALTLSWRTNRIQQSDLSAIESELESAGAGAGLTP